MNRLIFFATIFAGAPAALAPAQSLIGHWEGAAMSEGKSFPLGLDVEREGLRLAGTIDFPALRRKGYPLARVSVRAGEVTIAYGEKDPWLLEGRLAGARISGTFTIGERDWPFELERRPLELPYTEEEVTFPGSGVQLAGLLVMPEGTGPHPAIVHMHGSGDNPRYAYRYNADFFARLGVACLILDKRGNGGSTGDWREVGFWELAKDGVAAVHYLQTRVQIDPKQIGMTGISQAGWIMPMAASLSEDVAFLIVVSGGPIKVVEEGYYDLRTDLEDMGLPEDAITQAMAYVRQDREVTRSGEGFEQLRSMRRAITESPWWTNDLFFTIPMPLPPGNPNRDWYRRVMDIDHVPIVQGLRIPILWIAGSADRSIQMMEVVEILKTIKAETGNDFTIRVFPGANHGIRLPPADDAPFPFSMHARGYYDTMREWLLEHVELAGGS